MLDVRKLRMLAQLEDLGTIAAVARAMHLTAPGISMQLAALERETGIALTEKQGRRIVVTPAGKLLAQHARDIGDMLAVAEMEAAALREGSAGTYRIAAFPSAARSFVAQAWKELLAASGAPMLNLVESEPAVAIPALAAGEVELAVAHAYSNLPPLRAPGLLARPLGVERVLLALPSSGSQPRGPVDLAEYARHDWIVPHRDWVCHEMVSRACGSAGFEPRAVAEATDFSVQLALVQAGVGVALVPEIATTVLPEGVSVHETSVPTFRHHYTVIRQSSCRDRGLDVVQTAINAAAGRFLHVSQPGN